MKVTNVYSDKRRTSVQKAKETEVRQMFEDWKPGPEELLVGGKWAGPVMVEGAEDFWTAIRQVRAYREAQGLTLKAVSERCGIDVATLSKLENGKQANPTLFTMLLYVGAVGMRLQFGVGPRVQTVVQVSEIRETATATDGNTKPSRRTTQARRKAKARAQSED